MSEAITDDEDRDRMISQAMSLLLASSRVNHILHDAVLEIDKELDRLRAENERYRTERGIALAQLEAFGTHAQAMQKRRDEVIAENARLKQAIKEHLEDCPLVIEYPEPAQ